MEEPIGVRSDRVDATAPPPPPPAAGYTAPYGDRVTSTQTTVTPVAYRMRSLVWLLLAIVDVILGLRFIFYAAGANDVGFAHAMYVIGAALDAPFRGIFNVTSATAGHPLQWADILAIVVYTIAAWIVTRVMVIGAAPPATTRTAL
ncbi:MAG: hypothetical protein JOZ92_03900 [Candidatus Dormibacteraeota bacterium]|nr:hypothetical protein [Candidatus Dormibacteraeota bacterium]